MYLVIKHDFDNMDNENPWFNEIVGYTEDEIGAIKYINEITKDIKQYEGYDGSMYPYYTKLYVEKLL